jgi:hypothetical protein
MPLGPGRSVPDACRSRPRAWWHCQVTACSRTVCKTVGSAYLGSNPTPANTCQHMRKLPLTSVNAAMGPLRAVQPYATGGRRVRVSVPNTCASPWGVGIDGQP